MREKGAYHLYRPGEDLSDYHLIYRDFVSGYNLAAIREDLDFSPFTPDPVESKAYWYLDRNEKASQKDIFVSIKKPWTRNGGWIAARPSGESNSVFGISRG